MFKNKEQVISLVLTVLISVFMVGVFVYAATTIGNNVSTGTVTMTSASTSDDFWLGNVTADDDDYLYMDSSSTEYMMWDDDPGKFVISDDWDVTGVSSSTGGFRVNDTFVVSNAGLVTSTAGFRVRDTFVVSNAGLVTSTAGFRVSDDFIVSSAGVVTTTGELMVGDNTSAATTTIEIGIGSTAGCLKMRDADADAWTYCYTDGGNMRCGTTDVCSK